MLSQFSPVRALAPVFILFYRGVCRPSGFFLSYCPNQNSVFPTYVPHPPARTMYLCQPTFTVTSANIICLLWILGRNKFCCESTCNRLQQRQSDGGRLAEGMSWQTATSKARVILVSTVGVETLDVAYFVWTLVVWWWFSKWPVICRMPCLMILLYLCASALIAFSVDFGRFGQ